MDQNVQFIITVGTVIGMFLWLRNDINRLDSEIGSLRTEITSVRSEMTSLRNEITSIRESFAWVRGRMGYSETPPQDKEL